MGPETLAQVVRPIKDIFSRKTYPNLIVGLDVADDAAVYKVSESVAIIHTVDFFTPVVDDPYHYGAIAAANAMSDVYAMGGEVKLALNICCFPPKLPIEIMREILRGGAEKVAEAGGVLAGGHTVDDKEPKYGLSVIGEVHPDRLFTKAGARPGDTLLLTKPLGTGIITTAFKGEAASSDHIAAAVKSMITLNRDAAQILQKRTVSACTDITGFALLGHGYEIAEKSGVKLRFFLETLPFLDGARRYAQEWLFPGGSCKNESCYKSHVIFGADIPTFLQMLLYTPETSGGLLVAAAPDEVTHIKNAFKERQQPCWIVGEVYEGQGVEVVH